MLTTSEIIDSLSTWQCKEIADSIANLLESRPDYRAQNDDDVINLSIVSQKKYAEVREAFDSVRMHETSEPPTGMLYLAAAKLGMTCIPIHLGGTLASVLRESNPECRYLLRTKGLVSFSLIGRNPVGESNGRTRVSSAHIILPYAHDEGTQWHPVATIPRPKYRGIEQADIDVHLSKCGEYQILQPKDAPAELQQQRFIWQSLGVFDSVDEAKQFAANQDSSK